VRKESTCHVPSPLELRQPSLPGRPSRPREERPQRQLPESGKLARQPFSSVMPALEPAVGIARDEHDTHGVGPRERVADDGRCPACQSAQTTLLPGGDDRAQAVVVCQCRPSTCEGEPSARTLGTTLYRPGGRRTATLAERQLDAAESSGAAVANLRPGKKTEQTALRKEQIEHVTTLRQRVRRVCVSSVNTPRVPAGRAVAACGCPPRAAG